MDVLSNFFSAADYFVFRVFMLGSTVLATWSLWRVHGTKRSDGWGERKAQTKRRTRKKDK